MPHTPLCTRSEKKTALYNMPHTPLRTRSEKVILPRNIAGSTARESRSPLTYKSVKPRGFAHPRGTGTGGRATPSIRGPSQKTSLLHQDAPRCHRDASNGRFSCYACTIVASVAQRLECWAWNREVPRSILTVAQRCALGKGTLHDFPTCTV
ncbi:hypothetical protein Bbelb_135200 [Branchiostoma belcheri]|nr:hypothetical protein Bbelb_135200 [Branchiostoma belcheri]